MGVVLAGALNDGAKGLAAVQRAGGRTLVIDSGWTTRDGMLKAAKLAVPQAQLRDSPEALACAAAEAVGCQAEVMAFDRQALRAAGD